MITGRWKPKPVRPGEDACRMTGQSRAGSESAKNRSTPMGKLREARGYETVWHIAEVRRRSPVHSARSLSVA